MRTRFAPSPTGPLHLGHALSALTAWDLAQQHNGQFILRIEDIDTSRARPRWVSGIIEDLRWLGLSWPEPVLHQSLQLARYHEALDRLWAMGLLYPCSCNRRDVRDAVSAPQGATLAFGPDGLVYPGTCRNKPRPNYRPADCALRLDMSAALSLSGDLGFIEMGRPHGPARVNVGAADLPATVGDIVLARKDMGTSYHLSVVLDDAFQQISHVVRGDDLFDATKIHVVLQSVLGITSPNYLHHRLVVDDAGKRLAKRDDARAIALYRDDGLSPADIRAMLQLDKRLG